MLVGGVLLIVGIGLFGFGAASFVSIFAQTSSTPPLPPDGFFNQTVDLQVGSVVLYTTGIENFATGDQLTVFIATPSGGQLQRSNVSSSTPVPNTYVANEAGVHALVLQNTGTRTVTALFNLQEVDPNLAILFSIGFFAGGAGLIVFIVGLVLWIVDRGKARPQPTLEMPPPPS